MLELNASVRGAVSEQCINRVDCEQRVARENDLDAAMPGIGDGGPLLIVRRSVENCLESPDFGPPSETSPTWSVTCTVSSVSTRRTRTGGSGVAVTNASKTKRSRRPP